MGIAFLGLSIMVPEGSTAIPLYCESCGATVRLVAPVSLNDLSALARAFEDHHAECVLDAKERAMTPPTETP